MSLSSGSTPERLAGTPRWLRWAAIAGLTLLLHLIAFNWAKHQISPAMHAAPVLLEAQLHAAPAEPPLPPKPATPRKPSPPKPHPKPAPPPTGTGSPASQVITDPTPAVSTEPGNTTSTDKDDNQTESGNTRYKLAPPPSVELNYEVEALLKGETWNGSGKISWNLNGGNYVINGEASAFVTVLSFSSRGSVDEYGIAPVRYSEKPFRKSEVATHFTRERNTISFSASTTSYPIKGGEQDRASIIWQLAAIGRGDREKFVANTQFPIFVAGVRDGETWDIRVIGEESIQTGIGSMATWHLVRLPRPGTYDKKLDIWLAPEREWYPVRLRYTDVNGEYLDMAVSSITPLSP